MLGFKWAGVEIEHIEKLVQPTIVTRAVTFVCSENYKTQLFREELAWDDVVLAYELNEETLNQGLSFTVRLIVPSK